MVEPAALSMIAGVPAPASYSAAKARTSTAASREMRAIGGPRGAAPKWLGPCVSWCDRKSASE